MRIAIALPPTATLIAADYVIVLVSVKVYVIVPTVVYVYPLWMRGR